MVVADLRGLGGYRENKVVEREAREGIREKQKRQIGKANNLREMKNKSRSERKRKEAIYLTLSGASPRRLLRCYFQLLIIE